MKITHFLLLGWLTLACFLFGCGGQQKQSVEPVTVARTVDPSTARSITGTVKLIGAPPTMSAIDMSADPNCRQSSPVRPNTVIVGQQGELANVAVYVKSGLGNFRFEAPKETVTLAQKGCMYDPHILAVMVNQPVQITNADMTIHNVHSVSKINDSWNRSEPPGGQPVATTYTHPELAIPILCNVHPWMRSYLFVFAHPYYAITSVDGKFTLPNLPPGTYTIEAWHEKFGTSHQIVTLAPHASQWLSFTFNASSSNASAQ